MVAENIRKAREKMPKKEENKSHKFKINDLVLVKDPCSAVFEPRYQPNYRVTAIFGSNRIEVQDEKGHKSVRRSSHVKYVEPSEKVVQQLPSKELLQKYGRSSKILLQQKDIPDLKFTGEKVENTSEDREDSENSWETEVKTVEIIETELRKEKSSDKSAVTLQFSDLREYSQNSLNEVAGAALGQSSEDKKISQKEIKERCDILRDFGKHSQNSLNSAAGAALEQPATVESAEGNQSHDIFHESLEHSRNSLTAQGEGLRGTETKMPKLEVWRESEEHSLKSRVNSTVIEVDEVQQMVENTEVATCRRTNGESREDSQNSLTAKGKNVSVPKFSWVNSMTQIVGLAAAWHQGKVEGSPVGTSGAGNPKTNKTSVHAEFNFFL